MAVCIVMCVEYLDVTAEIYCTQHTLLRMV